MKSMRMMIEVVRSALVDLLRAPIASILAIVAMGVAVFQLSAFLVIGNGLGQVFESWADQSAVEVYLDPDIPEASARALAASLESDARVRRVDLIDGERAMEEFRTLFPDLEDVGELLGDSPLPPSLRVVPGDTNIDGLRAMAREMEAKEGVLSVRFDAAWIEALERLGHALRLFLAGGVFLLLVAALATVGSVVRLALDDKRGEVELMRLVGAPTTFVLAPVLVAGALLAGCGAAAAVGVGEALRGWAVQSAAATPLSGLANILLGKGLPLTSTLALVVGAAAAGLVAAGLAAGRSAVR